MIKYREFVRLLKKNGWFVVRTTGSHIHFKHPKKPGMLVVPFHSRKDVPTGLYYSLKKKGGIK